MLSLAKRTSGTCYLFLHDADQRILLFLLPCQWETPCPVAKEQQRPCVARASVAGTKEDAAMSEKDLV